MVKIMNSLQPYHYLWSRLLNALVLLDKFAVRDAIAELCLAKSGVSIKKYSVLKRLNLDYKSVYLHSLCNSEPDSKVLCCLLSKL